MDQVEFTQSITSKVKGELFIPFEDVGLENYLDSNESSTERVDALHFKQLEIVEWCNTIPGCNWSVGFIDTVERKVIVVKWWFGVTTENPQVELVE